MPDLEMNLNCIDYQMYWLGEGVRYTLSATELESFVKDFPTKRHYGSLKQTRDDLTVN